MLMSQVLNGESFRFAQPRMAQSRQKDNTSNSAICPNKRWKSTVTEGVEYSDPIYLYPSGMVLSCHITHSCTGEKISMHPNKRRLTPHMHHRVTINVSFPHFCGLEEQRQLCQYHLHLADGFMFTVNDLC